MAAPMLQPTKQSSMPSLIYILGGPGVGKGSLCTPLPKEFTNVYHLSVGDHLRDLQAQDSSQSTPQSFGGLDYETFSTLMQQRQLLPTETIVSIVDTALRVIADTAAASGVSNITAIRSCSWTAFLVQLSRLRWLMLAGVCRRLSSCSTVLVESPKLVS